MDRRQFLGSLTAAPLALRGQSPIGTKLLFLMYPQAEVDGVRRDSLDPATFKYSISARQV